MQDLPSWLKQPFKDIRCPHCFSPLQRAGIMALGFRESKRRRGKTVAFFEYDCKECKKTAMYEMHETSSEHFGLSLLEGKGRRTGGPVETRTSSASSAPRQRRSVVRPSLPRDFSKHPISDEEISQFLKRLKRTSFRRDTKSFRRWMEQLCDRST